MNTDLPDQIDLSNDYHQYLVMRFLKKLFSDHSQLEYVLILSDRAEMGLFNNLQNKEELAQMLREAHQGVEDPETEFRVSKKEKGNLH